MDLARGFTAIILLESVKIAYYKKNYKTTQINHDNLKKQSYVARINFEP